jgi:hypothetical protein
MEFKDHHLLRKEHDELHEELAAAVRLPGKIGEAAKNVAKIMHPHFLKEEEYALIPLGALSSIINGDITPDMEQIIPHAEKMKQELPRMLEEHKALVTALKIMIEAAEDENNLKYRSFAEKLILHSKNEEEVSYPTAILIGDYLKLKFNK